MGASNPTGQLPAALAFGPCVAEITVSDVNQAWMEGIRDFRAAPAYGLAFGAAYALGGLLILVSAAALDLTYLVYPLAAGFVLIGPLTAVGLYEVSRRQEQGMPLSWRAVIAVIFEQRNRQLAWMGFVTLFFFVVWLYVVQLLVALFLGSHSFASLHEFLMAVTATPEGIL